MAPADDADTLHGQADGNSTNFDVDHGTALAALPAEADGAAEAREWNEAQVRIDGLNSWSTVKMLRDMLQKLGVAGIQKVKKLQNDSHGFIYFCSVADRHAAEPKLQGHVWKKLSLSITTARTMDPNRFLKRQAASDAATAGGAGKKPRQAAGDGGDAFGDEGASSSAGASGVCEKDEEGSCGGSGGGSGGVGSASGAGAASEAQPVRTAADAVTPLHHLSYEEQLKRKHKAMLKELRKLPAEMHRAAKSCPEEQRPAFTALKWLAPDALRANGQAPCPLVPVTRSPLEAGYRNKCEFSVGRDVHGAPCVGFMLGQVSMGATGACLLGQISSIECTGASRLSSRPPPCASFHVRSGFTPHFFFYPPSCGPLFHPATRFSPTPQKLFTPPSCASLPPQVRLHGVAIASPSDCRNVSPHMRSAVARLQTFIQRSTLPPYDKLAATGFWRQVTMRQSFQAGDPPALLIVLMVQHCGPGGAGVDEAVAESEMRALVEHMQVGGTCTDAPPGGGRCDRRVGRVGRLGKIDEGDGQEALWAWGRGGLAECELRAMVAHVQVTRTCTVNTGEGGSGDRLVGRGGQEGLVQGA
jgi:hypothetical protein